MGKRLKYIDASKALAIILVIVGHCYWKSAIPIATPFIYSFHMPLFFIISGMFLKELSLKEALLKYSKNYILPYLVGCGITLILSGLMTLAVKGDVLYSIKNVLIAVFFSKGSVDNSVWGAYPAIGALWFLVALFWGCTIVSAIKNYYNNFFTQFLIVVFLFSFSYVTIHRIRLPLAIQVGMSCSLFIWIGSLIKKYNLLDVVESSKASKLLCVLIWCISVLGGGCI